MRYLVWYAVYALTVSGVLLHLVPPQPPSSPAQPQPRPRYIAEVEVALTVVDDYFSQPCTVKVSAFAADMVMFNTREEFETAREAIGC